MKKFNKIFLKVVSYIGALGMGAAFGSGMETQFDKWVCCVIIFGAILLTCSFIGSEECIPEDEKED